MAVESMVETGVSFTSRGGQWRKHSVALDLEIVGSRLEGEAVEKWEALPLSQQILVVRAIEEVLLCQFRKTRHDPDYTEGEEKAWVSVLDKLVGSEGRQRVGV